MPYLWAAYRKGGFDVVHPVFKEHLTKEEFLESLVDYMQANVLVGFVFLSNNRPVGYGLFWERGRILQTENLIWFPWASDREILESYINFIVNIKKEKHEESGYPYVVLEFAQERDKRFFDQVCRYGVMHRVGTSLHVYPDGKSCIYESRS